MEEETNKNGTWTGGRARNMRKKINEELRELYKDLDIVADIKKKRLEWTGHVVRMDQGRTVKKILKVNRKEVEEGEDQD
jgi:hypothetical protein